jgi:hypothetical protein
MREVEVGLVEPEAQGVAVGDLEAGDRRVVVELAGLLRLRAELVEAGDLAFEEEGVRRAVPGVEEALDRVGIVGGGELAPAAAEGGVVG